MREDGVSMRERRNFNPMKVGTVVNYFLLHLPLDASSAIFGVLLHFHNFFISFVVRSTQGEINLTRLLNLFLPSLPNEWERRVCVCVREREREGERQGERKGERGDRR